VRDTQFGTTAMDVLQILGRDALDAREAKIRFERKRGNQWREQRGYELYPDFPENSFVDHLKPLVLLSINTGADSEFLHS
jgi:hypothetical protein